MSVAYEAQTACFARSFYQHRLLFETRERVSLRYDERAVCEARPTVVRPRTGERQVSRLYSPPLNVSILNSFPENHALFRL